MKKTANKETVVFENNRKVVKVDTITVQPVIEGKDFRKKYNERQELKKEEKKKKHNW